MIVLMGGRHYQHLYFVSKQTETQRNFIIYLGPPCSKWGSQDQSQTIRLCALICASHLTPYGIIVD